MEINGSSAISVYDGGIYRVPVTPNRRKSPSNNCKSIPSCVNTAQINTYTLSQVYFLYLLISHRKLDFFTR